MHIHTYINTNIFTMNYCGGGGSTSMKANAQTYTHTHIHTYIHTYIQRVAAEEDVADMQQKLHTYTYTYIHTYIHTYIYTYSAWRLKMSSQICSNNC